MVWTPTKDYNIVRSSPTSYYFSLTSAESSRRVQPRRIKLSRWFFGSIPIEIDLLKIKMKRKYAKIILEILLQATKLVLELTILYSQTRSELRLKIELHEFSDFN